MKRVIWLISVLLVACPGWAAEGPAGPPPARVVVASVEERVVAESTPIVGTLYFDTVSDVSTEVSGLVQSVPFKEGDRLKKGDILVKLDTDFLDKNIALAVAKIEQVDVQIERAEKDLERYEALYRRKATPEKTYDECLYCRLELLEKKEQLLTELEIARLKKVKSAIRAPFDGIVLEKLTEIGNWVSPGDGVCRLGALDELCVKVPIAEELIVFTHPGNPVEVALTAFHESVEGTVTGFLPVADQKTKNVMVKIRLPRIPNVVENMSATVLIPTSPPKTFTLIPRDALVNSGGQEFVYTVKNGNAVRIPITVSTFTGEYAGIDSPSITAGMPVIVDGAQRLRPGQPVEIIKEQ
jgi:RND family efflux transporter MFP subunit